MLSTRYAALLFLSVFICYTKYETDFQEFYFIFYIHCLCHWIRLIGLEVQSVQSIKHYYYIFEA